MAFGIFVAFLFTCATVDAQPRQSLSDLRTQAAQVRIEIERLDQEAAAAVERYNLAVDLYNDGHFARAVSILERLLAEHPGGPHADAASRLLADARAAAPSDP